MRKSLQLDVDVDVKKWDEEKGNNSVFNNLDF